MTRYNDLLTALRRITRAIDLYSKRLAKETGLTAPQLLVMQAVAKSDGIKPSDVARQVHLSQATVTTILDRLVRADLVTRARSDSDRRSVEISLTQAGRDRLKAAPELLQEEFLSSFRMLDDWEQTQLVSSVQRIASMMDAQALDAAPILEVGEIADPAD